MKTYANLSDRLKIKDKVVVNGRYGETHADFINHINYVIGRATEGLSMDDFGDTVFTVDAWQDGCNPVDTAEEILLNDCIGEQFLGLFLNWNEVE